MQASPSSHTGKGEEFFRSSEQKPAAFEKTAGKSVLGSFECAGQDSQRDFPRAHRGDDLFERVQRDAACQRGKAFLYRYVVV